MLALVTKLHGNFLERGKWMYYFVVVTKTFGTVPDKY